MQNTSCRRGFTLVELLVVIGIIGVLAGVLIGTVGGATESARSAKCLANMRNLAVACQSYGMKVGIYPLAASMETSRLDESDGIRNVREIFSERPGWISWASEGAYMGKPTNSKANTGWFVSSYTTDEDVAAHCLTNGVLWKYVSGNRDVYLCPAHVKKAKELNFRAPHWSYMMNGYFGGDVGMTGDTLELSSNCVGYGSLPRSDRYLLFSELPFYEGIDESAIASDPTMQYKGMDGQQGTPDAIHFNHKSGKNRCAHVAYADGHVDKLLMPKGETDARELAQWLCEGKDVGFNGSDYEKLTD